MINIMYAVDPIKRIVKPMSEHVITEQDHEASSLRFAFPDNISGTGLESTGIAVRVMYIRPDGGDPVAKTLTFYGHSGGYYLYDWNLQKNDLQKEGCLVFSLCILRTDTEVEEWHTTPYQIRVLGSIHTDDSDQGDETITPTVAQRVAVLESMIQRVASGAPVVVGSASDMTDTAQIYVLTTDGYWYYHDGTEWVQGGVYGAITIETDTTLTVEGMPADSKAVGEAIAAGGGESFYINNPNNILDWTAEGVLEGKIWYTTNASTTNGSGNISDFMEVEPGETICINYCAKLKWFNAEKAFLANPTGVSDKYYITVTAPEGAAYFKVQVSNEHKDGAWVYRYYGEYYDFSAYADHVTTPVVTDASAAVAIAKSVNAGLVNGDVDMSKVQDDVLSYDMIDQLETFRWSIVDNTKNLVGWRINASTGEVGYSGLGTSTEYVTTDYCKVKPGEAYKGYNGSLYGYDADKAYVGGITASGTYAWTIPEGVYYVRACQLKTVNETHTYSFSLVKDGYGQTFGYNGSYPYERAFPIFKSDDEKTGFKLYLDTEPWRDKKILVIGDSFSAPGVWQTEMCNNFYATLLSSSISGAGWTTGRTKTVYQLAQEVTGTPDIIMITLGTNDVNDSAVQPGDFVDGTSVEDYSEDTWYGGMQKALTYIRNRWTGVPVFVGFTPGAGSFTGSGRSERQNAFIAAMKEICLLYSCVYIETRTCGMAYPLVQGDLIFRRSAGDGHPSTEGQHQIARYMTDLMSGYKTARSWYTPAST